MIRPARAAVAPLLLLLGCAAAACSKQPAPYVANVDAVGIVRQNSADAFEIALQRPHDDAALRSFAAAIAQARDRAQVLAAWRAVPALAARGADLLEQKVFALAVQEQRWPRADPPEQLEPAFAEGVRLGVQDFLGKPR